MDHVPSQEQALVTNNFEPAENPSRIGAPGDDTKPMGTNLRHHEHPVLQEYGNTSKQSAITTKLPPSNRLQRTIEEAIPNDCTKLVGR